MEKYMTDHPSWDEINKPTRPFASLYSTTERKDRKYISEDSPIIAIRDSIESFIKTKDVDKFAESVYEYAMRSDRSRSEQIQMLGKNGHILSTLLFCRIFSTCIEESEELLVAIMSFVQKNFINHKYTLENDFSNSAQWFSIWTFKASMWCANKYATNLSSGLTIFENKCKLEKIIKIAVKLFPHEILKLVHSKFVIPEQADKLVHAFSSKDKDVLENYLSSVSSDSVQKLRCFVKRIAPFYTSIMGVEPTLIGKTLESLS